MMRTLFPILILTAFAKMSLCAQQAADSAAIHETVLDYIDAWWTGDATRMERCLHPDLVKRRVVDHRSTGRSLLLSDTRNDLVEYTRAGGGNARIEEKGRVEVSILALHQGAASVVAASASYVDYLHLARWNDRWVIVNVLWVFQERRPR